MKEPVRRIQEFIQNRMDWFEDYKSSPLRIEMLKIIQSVFIITNYLERSRYVEDYVITEFEYCIKKIFKYIEEDLIDSKLQLDEQIFSLEEWNTASKERKLSIISFVLSSVKPNQIKADDFETTFQQFDKETLEWIKDNSPYEEVRESLAYHYCKDNNNE